MQDGIQRRSVIVSEPNWVYDQADMTTEVGTLPFRLEVAQISARFGVGLAATLTVQD